MDNPFFKNNGPFKFRDILKELGLENDQNIQDQNIIDIKDLKIQNQTKLLSFIQKNIKQLLILQKLLFV
jgi:UDP-3-O-[3-hydroxymyristoyl] glucosamine N-acyltransferase